jgi:hypothetical protein
VIGAFLETRHPDLWRELGMSGHLLSDAHRQGMDPCHYVEGEFRFLGFVWSRRAISIGEEVRVAVWTLRGAMAVTLSGLAVINCV